MDANKMPQNLACGLLSVQRLHREALSAHGDVYQPGARAALRPYSTITMKMPSDFSVQSTSLSQDKRPLTIAEVIPCALVTGP